MIEIAVSVVALLVIVLLGRKGAAAGFYVQGVTTVLALFAMIVALRFWFPCAVWLSGITGASTQDMAFGAFWAIFSVVFAPFYGLLRSLNDRVVPVYPIAIERAFGFIAGCLFGAILAASAMTSLLLYLPKVWPDYDASRLLLPLDRAPMAVYRSVENAAVRLGRSNDEKIVFPGTGQTESGELTSDWE